MLTFQSSVVTSLLFSFVLPLKCFKTRDLQAAVCAVTPDGPSGIIHILAVESPELFKKHKRYFKT